MCARFVCSLEDLGDRPRWRNSVSPENVGKDASAFGSSAPTDPLCPDGTTREDKIAGNWHQAEENGSVSTASRSTSNLT